jgi:hypothetical protein
MNGIYMATEIFVQCKSLGMSTAGDITLESTLVALGVLTSGGVSVKFQILG